MAPQFVQVEVSEYARLKEVVTAAVKYVDAEIRWENNPSKFAADTKKDAEAARVARETLKGAVLKRRQSRSRQNG